MKEEMENLNQNKVHETEVKVYVQQCTELEELEGILGKINQLKQNYPYTKFSVEVVLN